MMFRAPKAIAYTPIGIDIGDQAVRAVQFSKKDGALRLRAAAVQQIRGAEGSDNGEGAVVAALKRVLVSGDFIGRDVISAVPSGELDVRPISLPPAVTPEDGARFQEALLTEARSCLLYDPAEAVINYLTLSATDEGPGRRAAILLLACRKEAVTQHVGLLKAARLECTHLDTGPSAAVRLLGEDQGVFAVVQLDRSRCVVSMGKKTDLLFSRTIPFGTGRFVEAIARSLDVDEARAARMLLNTGIDHAGSPRIVPEEVEETGRVREEALPAGLFEICSDGLRQLAGELRRSFNYFSGLPSGDRIEKTILVGSELPTHVDRYLEHELGLPVTVGDAFAGFSEGSSTDPAYGSAFVLAAGLALREEFS